MYVFSMAYTKLQITYGACPILFFPLLCHCLHSGALSYWCNSRCYFGYFSLLSVVLFYKGNGEKGAIKLFFVCHMSLLKSIGFVKIIPLKSDNHIFGGQNNRFYKTCTFQIEVQQTATFFMVSNLWKTPRVCPAARGRTPEERYRQYKKKVTIQR